jgi:hypothetical protein
LYRTTLQLLGGEEGNAAMTASDTVDTSRSADQLVGRMFDGADAFTGPTDDPVERFMYGASVLICLPRSMAERPTAATGMRTDTVRRYATEAGLRDVLPIEHDVFRLYRLLQ